MSEAFFPINQKHCATCAYWCGSRRLNATRNNVMFESYSTKGTCQGTFMNCNQPAQGSCRNWKQAF